MIKKDWGQHLYRTGPIGLCAGETGGPKLASEHGIRGDDQKQGISSSQLPNIQNRVRTRTIAQQHLDKVSACDVVTAESER